MECWKFLCKARFRCWNIAPLLDNWLLDLSWVGAGSGADLFGDVNALFSRLEQWDQLSHMLALLSWFQVASLFGNLLDSSLLLLNTLLWSWLQLTSRWATELTCDLLALSFWGILLDILLLCGTDLLGPLGTLPLSGVSIGDIFTLLLLDSLAIHNIILHIMLMESGLALRLINSFTFNWALSITNKWGVAALNFLIRCNGLVLNETLLHKVLLTFLFLLWFEICGVSSVALLAVAVLALNDIIILSLFNHNDLVNTSLSSGGNGSNVKGNLSIGTLTGSTCWQGKSSAWSLLFCVVMMLMMMFSMVLPSLLAEWEDSTQVLSAPFLC